MNYRETRLKDETGFLWAGIKSDEFLKNSAAIFCKKISSEKAEKKCQKINWFFFGIIRSEFCQRSRRQQLMKEFRINFKAICYLWSEFLKNPWSKRLRVIKKEEKDNKQNIDD